MTVYVGQDVKVVLVATNPDGSAAQPAGVRFRLKPPTGDTTSHVLGIDEQVSEEEEGLEYAFTFDASVRGKYIVRAETLDAGGGVVGVDELTIIVSASKVV
jgi:hypothetical protein